MTKKLMLLTACALALGMSGAAWGKASSDQVARLGKDLTPFGSERKGDGNMIPDWEGVLRRALALLAPQTGRLLIADFGGCEAWPGPLARRLCKNLSYFHVTPRPQLAQFLRSDRSCGTLQVTQTRLLGGYGQVLEVGRRSSSRGAIGHA